MTPWRDVPAWRPGGVAEGGGAVTMLEVNQEMEARWRRGEISFGQFDWHLRWMCGV